MSLYTCTLTRPRMISRDHRGWAARDSQEDRFGNAVVEAEGVATEGRMV
jgi:hypothetical protein